MIITNFKTLARSSLRAKALKIVEAGYVAIDIEKAVKNRIKLNKNKLAVSDAMKVHSIDLGRYKNIYLIGIGKGSALASATLAKILNKRLTKGVAIDVDKLQTANGKLQTFIGTHPTPSAQNIKATKKIIELAQKAGKDDLIISFICGGGSALLCGSEKELKASKEIFGKLTAAGANIIELNTIRKHFSEVKGGGLAKIVYPATLVSLVVSDVLGNDLSMVASGPTIFDKTTRNDAEKILKKYGLLTSITRNLLIETPKAKPRSEPAGSTTGDKKYFEKVKNIMFISNREPVLAMAGKAKKLGFSARVYSYKLSGEAKNSLLPLLKTAKNKSAVIAAGETTIKLGKNPGKGGRNMEAVLGALNKVSSSKLQVSRLAVVSFASDGKDNVDAAGAIGDVLTINKAKKSGLDMEEYLKNHNTFEFFKKTGDLILADKKTFNVSDLMLVIREK